MNYLLDTQVLLWNLFNDPRFPEKTRKLIMSSQNEAFVSVVSAWETGIKKGAQGHDVKFSVGSSMLSPEMETEMVFSARPGSMAEIPD